MLLQQLDINRIVIKQPKRIDTFMSSKLVYDEEKLFIDIPQCCLVSLKQHNDQLYCKFKLNLEQEKLLLGLEEHIVGITTDNANVWFKSKINANTMDEHFVSSLVVHRKHKSILKLRIESTSVVPDSTLIGSIVDIKLKVLSLRFLKTSFWVCYDLVECKPSLSNSAFVDDEDTSSIVHDDDDIGPDYEEREALRIHYMKELSREIDKCRAKIDCLNELHGNLAEHKFTLATFDAVENAIA